MTIPSGPAVREPVARLEDPPASLTPHERDWLRYAAMGYTVDNIAYRMGLSFYTARDLGQRVREKLGVHSTIEALRAVGWLVVP